MLLDEMLECTRKDPVKSRELAKSLLRGSIDRGDQDVSAVCASLMTQEEAGYARTYLVANAALSSSANGGTACFSESETVTFSEIKRTARSELIKRGLLAIIW